MRRHSLWIQTRPVPPGTGLVLYARRGRGVSLQDELEAVAERFGLDLEPARRGHLLSHVLAAISARVPTDDVVLFGGTALPLTRPADARLSEDIGLIALVSRAQVAAAIESAVARGFARSHGCGSWLPALTAMSGSQPATLSVEGLDGIQVQLLAGDGCTWPTEVGDIEQRCSDALPARRRTLPAPASAAANLAAWMDRRASRDLYDQWAMSERGLIDGEALDVVVRHGPTGKSPGSWVFESGPDDETWRRALGHQACLTVTAIEALATAQAVWAAATGS